MEIAAIAPRISFRNVLQDILRRLCALLRAVAKWFDEGLEMTGRYALYWACVAHQTM